MIILDIMRKVKTLLMLLCLPGLLLAQKRNKNRTEVSLTVDTALFAGLQYRSVGPSRGGRATAVAGVRQHPFRFYMGASGGGVWQTNDAGVTWQNISDGQIAAGSIGAIAVAPSDANVVYVGTGSACPRGNVSAGVGLYRSTDGGRTWQFSGLPHAGQIGRIVVHPANPDLVYVAVLGNIFGPNPERGVYRSADGGRSWQQVLFVSDSTGAIDLAMDSHNPRVLYAAMWRAQRKPWTLIDGGNEGGIWRSIDGGDSWQKLTNGLPEGTLGRIGLAVSPANSQRVWALIQAKEEEAGGLYRSDDGGRSWQRINGDHKLRQRGWYYTHITAHPTDENTVYACNTGFYVSYDGGKTFDQRLPTPHGDNHGVWINPDNPDIMINCNDGGANVSLNGGKTWSSQLTYTTAEFYRVTVDNSFPFRLYAGQQDNSTISVPSHRDRLAITPYEEWFNAGGSESGDVAVDPVNPSVVYAGTYSGEITYLDRQRHYIRQVTAYPHYTEGTEQRHLKYRWQWNYPIAINPFNPNEVYQTSNYVMRSTDRGQSWQVISPDLTRQLDQYHGIPGGPVQHDGTGVEIYSTIFAFEISALEEGVFWAGSDDGLIHISRDGGRTWQNITPHQMPDEGTVNKIWLSDHAPGRALVAVYRYRYNDFKPYIFLTNDYGKSWRLLANGSNGIPPRHFVRAVAEDPQVKGLLYAGTEYGMYVSFDEGRNWQPLQLNLPVVPITDIAIKDNSLALSTQGRAFWVLDDLTPLREAVGHNARENILYTPAPAYRTLASGMQAVIHYYIGQALDSATQVKLSVLDETGRTMVAFATQPDEAAGEQPLEVAQGFNTLEWDLFTTGPRLVDDFVSMVLRAPADGPPVPPGTYEVRLQIGADQYVKPLEVKTDPRWDHLRKEDFVAQYKLGMEMKALIDEAYRALVNIRSVRQQIEELAERAVQAGYNKELQQKAALLSRQLTAVEDRIIQNKVKTSQDAINYPRKFLNHVGRVYSVHIYNQGPPTGGVLERWADVQAEYAAIRQELEAALAKVDDFNKLLEKEGVAHIIVPYAEE